MEIIVMKIIVYYSYIITYSTLRACMSLQNNYAAHFIVFVKLIIIIQMCSF